MKKTSIRLLKHYQESSGCVSSTSVPARCDGVGVEVLDLQAAHEEPRAHLGLVGRHGARGHVGRRGHWLQLHGGLTRCMNRHGEGGVQVHESVLSSRASDGVDVHVDVQ